MTVVFLPAPYKRRDRAVPRWMASSLVVLALHVTAMIGLLAWQVPAHPSEPPATILIDLMPRPTVAPAAAPPPPVDPPTPPEPPEPPPEPIAVPKPTQPAAVPLSPKPVHREPHRHRPVHQPKPTEPPPPAPKPLAAEPSPAPPPAAPTPTAPAASAAANPSPDALSDFERALLAHLERRKRYPRAAQMRREQGVAYLRFTMDRNGKVLAARIERSSGHADLDAEVLALIRRAEPLPPLPADVPQAQLDMVVPVQFFLR